MSTGQLSILVFCKRPGCLEAVVGHSITGEGQVCRRHNIEEWGRSLASNREPYFRRLGMRLLADTQKQEDEGDGHKDS